MKFQWKNGIKIGKKVSEKTKIKMSLTHKGIKNSGRFTSERMKGNQVNKGRKTWNYIDGKQNYYGSDWKKVRVEVLKRDNNQCQLCGKFEGRLEIHHKIPFVITKDNSLNNLITLCAKCHRFVENENLRKLKNARMEVKI